MKVVHYHYALDEQKHIVDIDEVTPIYREQHTFHCLSCGAEMIAKLGDINAHHFAHKVGTENCGLETYLHKLGKRLLKYKFDNSEKFLVEYNQIQKCSKHVDCLFYKAKRCKQETLVSFDLKEYYDTCTEEKAYQGYVADLLLESREHPQRPPVFIEIFVTHECTTKKYASGNKIIEVEVKSDEQLKRIVQRPLSELNYVRFIGFNRENKTPVELAVQETTRFILYPSGAAYVYNIDDLISCNVGRLKSNSLLELNFEPWFFSESIYNMGYVTALKMGYNVKVCNLCKYFRISVDIWSDDPKFCCLSKKYGTPRHPKSTDAQNCKYYRVHQGKMAEIEDELKQIPIMVVK